jgi:hypothetical protein
LSPILELVIYLVTYLICFSSGLWISLLLWPRKWANEMLLACPIIGTAWLTIVTSALNFLGIPVDKFAWILLCANLVLDIILLITDKYRTVIIISYINNKKNLLLSTIIGFASGLFVLVPIILFKGFNAYGDTFTYISIADYVAKSGFLKTVPIDHLHPILSQPYYYQLGTLRMGAQYILATISVLFKLNLSIVAYLPVAAFFIWILIQSIWIFCNNRLQLPSAVSLIAIGFTAVNLSFFIYNASTGFFPQTLGIVFSVFLLSIWPLGTENEFIKSTLLIGLMIAGLIISYTEITPFIFLASVIVQFMPVLKKQEKLINAIKVFIIPLILGLVLSHFYSLRIVGVLFRQGTGVYGWDITYNLWEYIIMLYSFIPSKHTIITNMVFYLFTIFFTYLFIKEFVLSKEFKNVKSYLFELAIPFILAIVYFKFFKANPWNNSEMGQSWSIYKAVQYGFFLFPPAIAIALYQAMKAKRLRYVTIAAFCAYLVVCVGINIRFDKSCAQLMAASTGNYQNPVSEYFKLRNVIENVNDHNAINLEMPLDVFGHRQLVAYFLQDMPVNADWSEDVYVNWYVELDSATQGKSFSLLSDAPLLVYQPNGQDNLAANMAYYKSTKLTKIYDINDFHWLPWRGDNGSNAIIDASKREITAKVPVDAALVSSESLKAGSYYLEATISGYSPDKYNYAHISLQGISKIIAIPAGNYDSKKINAYFTVDKSGEKISFGLGGWGTGTGKISLQDLTIYSLTAK